MNRLAVIGHPIGHSVSPAMHTAAMVELGLDGEYLKLDVAPEDLRAFVDEMRAGEWAGVNVTVPHKELIVPLLDGLSPEAAAIGAVNTLVHDGDRLIGHNTDARGFLRALRDAGQFDPDGRTVALIGAGGAARAVLWSLFQARAARVLVINRTAERAEKLVAAAADWGKGTECTAALWSDNDSSWAELLAGFDAVVNATSVGLRKEEISVPADALPEDALAVDLIYGPRPTRFLALAEGRGLRTLDGLPMLVYQGAASFEMWTGLAAPIQTMHSAAEEAVGRGYSTDPGLGIALMAAGPTPARAGRPRRHLRPGKHRR